MAFQKIDKKDLRLGMYVKLDCSWWKHPFASNEFKVTKEKDLATIQNISKVTIFYNPALSDSEAPEGISVDETPSLPPAAESSPSQEPSEPLMGQEPPHEEEKEKIKPPDSFHQESSKPRGGDRGQRLEANHARYEQLKAVEHAYTEAIQQTKFTLNKLSRTAGNDVQVTHGIFSHAEKLAHNDQTIHAFLELMNAENPKDYPSSHALNVSILSMIVGKEMGLSPEEVRDLGLGALLHDIGIIHGLQSWSVAIDRFMGERETEDDSTGHIEQAEKIIGRIESFPESSRDIILQHHERLDGSGFPHGLTESNISPLAQIMMVIDVYDEMCRDPDRENQFTPYETLAFLYHSLMVKKQNLFSLEALIALIRTLGIYPPGTMVELNDGSIGAVININSGAHQAPRILLYEPGLPKNEAPIVDLAEEEGLEIKQSLRPNQVNPTIRGFLSPKRSKRHIPSTLEKVAAG